MFRRVVPVAILVVSALGAAPLAQQPTSTPPLEKGPTLSGFAPSRRAAHLDLEKRFDGELKAENLRAWMHRLAARPHHLGSPYGKDNAEFIAGLFRSWGYEVAITDYQVLFPTPILRKVELVAPTKFVASLTEPALKEDATSNQAAEALPPFNAYSPDGDVTAELVYVNYGVPADYEELERRGIDVKGKIVIARYGGSWRGIKPKVAAEHGAVGCLIYSDPREDGYFQGDVYPNGGWRSDRARPARLGGGHADLSRRSADARRRRDQGRQAPAVQGSGDADEDPGAADLLRRRAAAAQGARRPGGAGGLARRAAAHLPHRSRPGPRPPAAAVRLEARARPTTSSRR